MRSLVVLSTLSVLAVLLIGCGGTGGTTIAIAPAAHVGAKPPVLAGPWGTHQEGYGHVEPPTIFNGGDGSGLVNHIEWLAWGGSRAVGLGSGLYVTPTESNAEGTRESAVIVLFRLGYCHGRHAYNAITWFYPQHGQHFNAASYINACSGTYHE